MGDSSGRRLLVRSDARRVRDHQVAVISGGGSQHVAAQSGFLGLGMLSAAVWRKAYQTPDLSSVAILIRAVTGKAGAVLIVADDPQDEEIYLPASAASSFRRLTGRVDPGQGSDSAFTRGNAIDRKDCRPASAAGRDLANVAAIARSAADSVTTVRSESHAKAGRHGSLPLQNFR